MKTHITLLILLILSSLNALAQDEPRTIIHTTSRSIKSIAFSPDGKTLASIRDSYIDLWNVSTGGHKFSLHESENGPFYSIAFSPDGNTLATGANHGTLCLWDVVTGERKTILKGHTEPVIRVLFSPDGDTLASMSNTGWQGRVVINLWDTDTWTLNATLSDGHINLAQSFSFSPDSSTLASANQRSAVDLWDVSTGELKKTLVGHTGAVYSTSFSPDGQTLASGSSDGTVRLWDVATGELKNTIERHTDTDTDRVNRVMFSPDGKTLLINMQHDKAHLLDVDTSTYKASIKGKSGSFSPDSSILATIESSTVYLWDVETTRPKAAFDVYQNQYSYSEYNNVLFSPDGSTLATYNDEYINLWNLQTTNRVSITPYRVVSPANGQHFTINVSIENGQNIGGYQFSVIYDSNVLRYVGSANDDYLSPGAFPIPPIEDDNKITLAATSVAGTVNGDGNLATITFEVLDIKATNLILSDVILTDSDGEILPHLLFNTGLVIDPRIRPEDVNSDGIVNIIDLVQVASRFNHTSDIDKEDINGDGAVNIVDLVKVAAALGAGENAPSLHSQAIALFTAKDVQHWLTQAQAMNLTDATSQQGIHYLLQLLAAFTPKKTALLPNYPNPFNPETWIPYQLAKESEVAIIIYDAKGKAIRTLTLGTMPAGLYQNRSHAAYWNGTNALGEPVASGIYFYTLFAGNFIATRKLLILK